MTRDTIPEAWKTTIITPLVRVMFKAAGSDLESAWEQAIQFIKAHAPKTEQELRMLVRMAILNAQANLSFAESIEPDVTTTQIIRLRTNGLSLINAADKAEQRLNKLQSGKTQKVRNAPPVPEETAETASENAPEPQSAPEKTAEDSPQHRTAQEEGRAISAYARKNNLTYAEAWIKFQREKKAQTQPIET